MSAERTGPTVAVLVELLREVAAEEVPADLETSGPETIRALGLTSVRILEFLVEVEDRLGIEWGEELSPEIVGSFEAMAEYIAGQRDAAIDGRTR